MFEFNVYHDVPGCVTAILGGDETDALYTVFVAPLPESDYISATVQNHVDGAYVTRRSLTFHGEPTRSQDGC